jgi:hypothetical protein
LYRAGGLNIGRDDFSQRGIAEGLSQVVDAYNKAPDSQIVIRGVQSPSVRKGKGDAGLPIQRAEAAKRELVKRGVPPGAIHTEASPPSKADPHQVSPEEKANLRGATFEVVPPKKVPYSPKGFTDDIVYVKGKKKGIEWPPIDWPPDLGPIKPKLPVGEDTDDKPPPGRKKDDYSRLREFLRGLLERALTAGGIVLLGTVLPEILAAVALEYGEQKLADYLKEQLEKEKEATRHDKADRERFMREMLRRINADKHHPLRGLVDPATKNWVGRSLYPKGKGSRWTRLLDVLPAVQAGHLTSYHAGGRALALEDPFYNIFIKSSGERQGVVFMSRAVDIGGVPVEYLTARDYEAGGAIPAGTVQKAPWSVGWTP